MLNYYDIHSLCKTHFKKYVRVSLTNGVKYEGYIIRVDDQYVTLAVPKDVQYPRDWVDNDERNPLILLTLPLFFLAGLAVRRPPYPYPVYYPYPTPYPAYPQAPPYPEYPAYPAYPPYPGN